MKIGDRYYMSGNPSRKITVTGLGASKVFFNFDEEAGEEQFPYDEFSWWFSPLKEELPRSTLSVCDCGAQVTYNTDNFLYHSYWCSINGG